MATSLTTGDRLAVPKLLPTVLVAEDDEDEFFLLKRAFDQAGVCAAIERALNGTQAKEFLETSLRLGRALPVCAVLDLKMPVMNGFELLDYIKSQPALRTMPVIVLTMSKSPNDITRAYQAGVNSYIVKPVGFGDLVEISRAMNHQWFQANQRPFGTAAMS